VKVLFVASGKSDNKVSPIIANQGNSLNTCGIEILYFPLNKKGLTGYLQSIITLRAFLKRNPVDIIHAHYGLSAYVALFAKRDEVLIVSFMGDDIVGSNRIDGSVTGISQFLGRVNIFLSKNYFSHSIVKSWEMLNKVNHERISLIPNGVNTDVFVPINMKEARRALDIDPGKSLIIFVSDPSRVEKNFNLAKESVRELSDPNILLIPVWGKTQEVLNNYYNAADVVILTSYHEGSPNVIKEAMACNCPIVATNVGDVEWVIDNTKGCYLASFDKTDFSNKLRSALIFSKKSGRTNGREVIFSLGLDSLTIAGRIIKVYKKTLKICVESAE
jgi:glycosyltransferase involved in cell wall biosynthesis